LPNDYRTMVEVRNNGVPLIEQAQRASITQSIVALADALSGGPQHPPEISKAGLGRWLSFWPAGRGKSSGAEPVSPPPSG
jgi:pilus assembly protein CpaE